MPYTYARFDGANGEPELRDDSDALVFDTGATDQADGQVYDTLSHEVLYG